MNLSKRDHKYDWKLFLGQAKKWLDEMNNDVDETLVRCGISRAYYAAFHVCRQYLNSIGMSGDIVGEGSHKEVIEDFRRLGDARKNKECKKISEDLKRLKQSRVDADYKDCISSSYDASAKSMKGELEKSVLVADKLMKLVRKLQVEIEHFSNQ